MQYTLRQAIVEDTNILYSIHRENMQEYVTRVYSWNPTLFIANFTPRDYRVIKFESKVVGFIKVVTSKTDIYLAEIQIANNYQNQGIGTSIVKVIIEEAKLNNKPLWLKVIKGNPAEQLYKRLGFAIFQESATHKKMKIEF